MTRKIVKPNDRLSSAVKTAKMKEKRRTYAFEDPKILARANAIRIAKYAKPPTTNVKVRIDASSIAKKTWPRELRVAKISDAIVSAAKRDLGI